MIEMDSEFAKTIGFVSGRFLSCSYLWGEGNRIIIRTIECTDRRRGYLRELFKAIRASGVEIAVRTSGHHERNPSTLRLQGDRGERSNLLQRGALGEIDEISHQSPGHHRQEIEALKISSP